MADYSELKAAIRAAIYDNVTQEITGDKLQEILLEMVDELGQSYVKPANGIPDTDLAENVQTWLMLARRAVWYTPQFLTSGEKQTARQNIGAGEYTKPATGIPWGDLSAADIAAMTEEWTFTLADGTTVTKKVIVLP